MSKNRWFYYCFLVASLALVAGGCVSSCNHTSKSGLNGQFAQEFGFEPMAGISVLHCKTYQVGDCYGRYISFTADDASLQRVVSGGFTNATAEELSRPWGSHWRQSLDERSPNAPDWWRTPGTNHFRVFYKEPSRKDFGGSFHSIWIDDSTKTVYSQSAGWD
jgi:hypothetical protein